MFIRASVLNATVTIWQPQLSRPSSPTSKTSCPDLHPRTSSSISGDQHKPPRPPKESCHDQFQVTFSLMADEPACIDEEEHDVDQKPAGDARSPDWDALFDHAEAEGRPGELERERRPVRRRRSVPSDERSWRTDARQEHRTRRKPCWRKQRVRAGLQLLAGRDGTVTGLMINHDKIPHGSYYRFIFELQMRSKVSPPPLSEFQTVNYHFNSTVIVLFTIIVISARRTSSRSTLSWALTLRRRNRLIREQQTSLHQLWKRLRSEETPGLRSEEHETQRFYTNHMILPRLDRRAEDQPRSRLSALRSSQKTPQRRPSCTGLLAFLIQS